MIHLVEVSVETQLADLKKEVRKKLMTGGAVVRLPEALSAADCEVLFERFLPEAQAYNLATQVLVGLVRHPSTPSDIRSRLAELPLREIQRELATKC